MFLHVLSPVRLPRCGICSKRLTKVTKVTSALKAARYIGFGKVLLQCNLNMGQRTGKHLFHITRFRYVEVLFHKFNYYC